MNESTRLACEVLTGHHVDHVEELHKEAWKRCWEEIPTATLTCPHIHHHHLFHREGR